jgi:protease-4
MYNIPDFNVPPYDMSAGKKKGSGWKVFWGIVIVLSLLANGLMFLAIIGMSTVFTAGSGTTRDDGLTESVLIDGAQSKKIAVINIGSIIDDQMSEWVGRQIDRAEADHNVRGLIVRIVSPGGAVSSSDQIHYAINRFKERTGKPVLGFMQSVAASGGYYSAVACDEIMAEPTCITGSIGVIMNYMVLKELLEEKLGINPVTIKSGQRKDWPSMFNETTDEQKAYLSDKLITPAYNRFVDLVTEGRKDLLTEQEVRQLADGSIYSAPEAVENRLIDKLGYFDDAVYRVEQLARISDARVVEYQQRFSVWNILGVQGKNTFNFETQILEHLAAPRLLYLWDGK